MPAAAHVEKEGSFTNTQRLLQWTDKRARAARGGALGAVVHAPSREAGQGALRAFAQGPRLADPQPPLGLPRARRDRRAGRGGRAARGERLRRRVRCAALGLRRPRERRLDRVRLLDLLGRVRRRRQPGAPARARRPRRPGRLGVTGVGLGVAGQPPPALQSRVGRPGRQAVVRAQALRLVGRGGGEVDGLRRAGLPGSEASRLSRRPTTRRAWTRSRATTRSS